MTTQKPYRFAARLCLVCTVACGDDEPTRRDAVYENTGSLCLTQVGSQITINTDFGICLNGCSGASPAPRCSAAFESGTITVSSRADITTYISADRPCTTDCRSALAECGLTVPAEGYVSVVYGAEQANVRLPLTDATPLFGSVDPCP